MASILTSTKTTTLVSLLLVVQLEWQLVDSQFSVEGTTSVQDKMLKTHVIETFNLTAGLGDCMIKCDMNEFCLSFNFHRLSSVCELNDAIHLVFPEDFHNASHVIYMMFILRPQCVCKYIIIIIIIIIVIIIIIIIIIIKYYYYYYCV